MRSRATNFWGHLEGNEELVKQSKETAAALPILRVSIRRRGVADRAFFHSTRTWSKFSDIIKVGGGTQERNGELLARGYIQISPAELFGATTELIRSKLRARHIAADELSRRLHETFSGRILELPATRPRNPLNCKTSSPPPPPPVYRPLLKLFQVFLLEIFPKLVQSILFHDFELLRAIRDSPN